MDGLGLRRLDQRGVQIGRWRRVDNGSVERGIMGLVHNGSGYLFIQFLRMTSQIGQKKIDQAKNRIKRLQD